MTITRQHAAVELALRRGAVRATGLLLGVALDAALADPARWHPVAGFGRAAAWAERRLYRDSRAAGAVHTAVLVTAVAAPAAAFERSPVAASGVVLTAGVAWAVIGGASLRREGRRLAEELAADDLTAARGRLPNLCGRDPAMLDSSGIARAAIESIAENTSDAVVAPLWWGAVAGLPGLVAYRAVNTLDAMIGHRSERYQRFGWAAARADDLVNLLPARFCALVTCACAPIVGGEPVDAFWVMRRDGRSHPSPNAGQIEAAFAGALGLRLGGRNEYSYGVEHRPELGFGRPSEPGDVAAAARLSGAVSLVCLTAAALAAPVASLLAARSAARLRTSRMSQTSRMSRTSRGALGAVTGHGRRRGGGEGPWASGG